MKAKWLFLVLFISATAVLNAQNIRFGVKGGLNVSSVKFSEEVFDADNITGFHIGPIIEIMTPLPGIGLDGAVLFTQKGTGLRQKTIKNNFLEVPVNLKWKMILPLVKPYLSAGPYVGFRMAGDKSWSDTYGDIVRQIESKNFCAGLNFAAGAEIVSWIQLSVNYNLGLTDHFKTFDVNHPITSGSGKTRTWIISAAVFF
ncbi:MAG: PorT family protein [Tannerella sp.]|jgi:hypothetical protein|nr:PorT family protein [Tannerella sp.]